MNLQLWTDRIARLKDRLDHPVPTWKSFLVSVGLMLLAYFAGCAVGNIR